MKHRVTRLTREQPYTFYIRIICEQGTFQLWNTVNQMTLANKNSVINVISLSNISFWATWRECWGIPRRWGSCLVGRTQQSSKRQYSAESNPWLFACRALGTALRPRYYYSCLVCVWQVGIAECFLQEYPGRCRNTSSVSPFSGFSFNCPIAWLLYPWCDNPWTPFS